MKRFLLIATLLAVALAGWCKGASEVEFASREHDFGNIQAQGGPVSAVYTFVNRSTRPVSVVTVTNGGCGCTKPTFPLQPIAPGDTGEIKVTFNPSTFRGEVSRQVKVQMSDSRKRIILKFKAVVLPPAK